MTMMRDASRPPIPASFGPRRHPRGLTAFLVTILSLGGGCGGPADAGPAKYPVRGSVLVDGKPAAGLIVTFHNTDAKAPGNAARPVGVVDESGQFALSTDADRDGAVAGDYAATFYWPSDNTPNAVDRLDGRFLDVARSRFRPKVEPKENELAPFTLEAVRKPARPAARSAPLPREF